MGPEAAKLGGYLVARSRQTFVNTVKGVAAPDTFGKTALLGGFFVSAEYVTRN